MNKALNDIIQQIENRKQEIKTNYHVSEIGIFGSYVRDESTTDSDIDILVDFDTPIDLFKFLDLEEFLSKVTGGKVDLVSKKTLKPNIGKQILQEVKYL